MTGTVPLLSDDRRSTYAVIAVAVLLLTTGLAGCVGSDGSGNPADTDSEQTEENLTGNESVDEAAQESHVHDRWYDGADQRAGSGESTDTIPIVDEKTYTMESTQTDEPADPLKRCRLAFSGLFCAGWVRVPPDQAGTGTKIVPPGTGNVTVTVDYEQGNYDGVVVGYKDRNTRQWTAINEEPAAPGETLEITGVTLNDTDDGHADSSAWEFLVQIQGNPAPGPQTAPHFTGPGGLDVTVTVEAHRAPGPLPVEPPHPTFYDKDPDNATEIYKVATVSGTTDGQFVHAGPAMGEVPEGCNIEAAGGACVPARTGPGLIWKTAPGYEGGRADTRPDQWTELSGDIVAPLVPPRTQTLVAVVQFGDDSQSQTGTVEFCLRSRTSQSQGLLGDILECKEYDDQDTMQFTVPVPPGKVDSFYANNWGSNASRWSFLLHLRSPQTTSVGPVSVHSPGTFQGSFDMTVVSTTKAELTELPSWMSSGEEG